MPWYVNLTQIVNTLVFSCFVYITFVHKLLFGYSLTAQITKEKKERLEAKNGFDKKRISDDPKNPDKYLLKNFPYITVAFGFCVLAYLVLDSVWSVVSLNQSWAKIPILIQVFVFFLTAVYYIASEWSDVKNIKEALLFLVSHRTLSVLLILILYGTMTVIVLYYISPATVAPITDQIIKALP